MKFEELWKVKILRNLLKIADKKEKITYTHKHSIERDLNMIYYGFEAGLKSSQETKNE